MKKRPPFIRLYENYEHTASGCWIWKGRRSNSGYGLIKAFGRMVSCHRLSYELYNGPIPTGMEIMHSCANRDCINPDHLSAGTHQENMTEASERGAWSHVKRKGVSGVDRSQSKQVLVLGKPYGSINESERKLNLSSGTVSYWLKTNNSKAKVISRNEYEELVNGKRHEPM